VTVASGTNIGTALQAERVGSCVAGRVPMLIWLRAIVSPVARSRRVQIRALEVTGS